MSELEEYFRKVVKEELNKLIEKRGIDIIYKGDIVKILTKVLEDLDDKELEKPAYEPNNPPSNEKKVEEIEYKIKNSGIQDKVKILMEKIYPIFRNDHDREFFLIDINTAIGISETDYSEKARVGYAVRKLCSLGILTESKITQGDRSYLTFRWKKD